MKYLSTKTDFSLSLNDTLFIKGIAICWMLWHHLFFKFPVFGDFVFFSSQLGKICVALFLFVSGYGLTIQYAKLTDKPIFDTVKFQLKRLVKFYSGYWVVFILFVPLTVFLLNRGLSIPYGGYNPVKRLISDILGINGWESYIVTWWFNQLIIYFYLIFPLLYVLLKKWPVPTLLFGIIALYMNIPVLMFEAHEWILHFMLGIVFALNIHRINSFLGRFNGWIISLVLLVLFIGIAIIRVKGIIPFLDGTKLDGILSMITVLLIPALFRNLKYINSIFIYLGKHSMNIYLIHTFIYGLYFHNFIYSLKYPVIIFSVLLLMNLLLSIGIEKLKKLLFINKATEKICVQLDKLTFSTTAKV